MRFLATLTPLIVLLLSFSQVYSQVCTGTTPFFVPDSNICVIDCPIGYYRSISGTQQVCLTQLPMKAVVHPTVEERVFILTFSHTPIPYSTEQDLEDNVRLTMSSPTQPDTIVPVSASFLSDTKSIVQITLPDNQTIPIQATFRMEFFNLRTNQDSQTAAIGPAVFFSLSSNQASDYNDVVDALTRLDRGLEYTWIAVTTLNPYAFLYMNTKFYRETLEMFKRLNVQHGPIAARFLRSNNNKVSGFKAPNMFPILLMENEVTSGWNRYEENDMVLENRDPERVQDFEIAVANTVHYYDSTPLFLDNYGIQITVFFAVIVLIIIFEILNFVFRPKGSLAIKSKARNLLQAIRIYLRWNLLIASVMGSYQSLIFYIIVQIQALSSEDDSLKHNTLNFWFAIASFIILALGFPIFILYKIISIEKKRRTNNAAFEAEKEYYGIFFMFNNLDDIKSLTFIFALQVKAVVLATLTLLLYDHPVAQVATILCITIAFAIYIAVLRPFSRMIYNIYQLGNELVLVAFLSTLLYNSHQNEDEILDASEANASGYVIIAFWLLLPALSIIFGLAGFIMRLKGISTQKPLKPFVPVVTASGQRQEEVALKKPVESQEHTEGHEKLSVPNQTENYIRIPIAQGVGLENYRHNSETVHSGQQTKDASFQKSIMSLPHLDIVDEEVEREQGSAETPIEYNKTVPNFYKTNSSQIMTPIRASSFDRGNGLNESKETIPEFRGILPLPRISTSRDSRRDSFRDSRRDSPIMLDIPDADITHLSRRSQRRPMSNSVSFDRESMDRRRSVDMEQRRGSEMYAHESKSSNIQQKTKPNRSCYLSPSNTVLDARVANRSYMSSMQANRARFYEDDEGFKKFKERFTFDEL